MDNRSIRVSEGEGAWLDGMENGFGLGTDKMSALRELYIEKAQLLGMYWDDEAIAAVYKRGLEDAQVAQKESDNVDTKLHVSGQSLSGAAPDKQRNHYHKR
jgi:hypothetical protein